MEIFEATFAGSFPKEALAPKDGRPEYAFIGRSNVGKSSLINMICDRKEMARTSGKPGKTQTLNYFLINKSWYIVDLPGYGYAKISKKMREEWRRMIEIYMKSRLTLACAFVLIDSNVSPQKNDLEFINWLGEMQVPFVVAYTKTDKCKPAELERNLAAFQQELLQSWSELPQQFITSAETNLGREEILNFIDDINKKLAP